MHIKPQSALTSHLSEPILDEWTAVEDIFGNCVKAERERGRQRIKIYPTVTLRKLVRFRLHTQDQAMLKKMRGSLPPLLSEGCMPR
jgi:hypothetical protein